MGTWTIIQEDDAFILKNPTGIDMLCYAFDGPFQKNSYVVRSTDPGDPNLLHKIEGVGFSPNDALSLAHQYAVDGYHTFSTSGSSLDDQTCFGNLASIVQISNSAPRNLGPSVSPNYDDSPDNR